MVNLFTNSPGYQGLAEQVDKANALKRGKYNKQAKPIDPYLEMQNLYNALSGYFVRPLFPERDEVVSFKGFTLWIEVYTPEEFEYEGKTYYGDIFNITQAEIAGSENFTLEERLELHRAVLGYLRQDDTLEVAISKIQPRLNELKTKYKKGVNEAWGFLHPAAPPDLRKDKEAWRKLLLG